MLPERVKNKTGSSGFQPAFVCLHGSNNFLTTFSRCFSDRETDTSAFFSAPGSKNFIHDRSSSTWKLETRMSVVLKLVCLVEQFQKQQRTSSSSPWSQKAKAIKDPSSIESLKTSWFKVSDRLCVYHFFSANWKTICIYRRRFHSWWWNWRTINLRWTFRRRELQVEALRQRMVVDGQRR